MRLFHALRLGTDIEEMTNTETRMRERSELSPCHSTLKQRVQGGPASLSAAWVSAQQNPPRQGIERPIAGEERLGNESQAHGALGPLMHLENLNFRALDQGIAGFFSCSGKLFHVFTMQQVMRYRTILSSDDYSVHRKQVAFCCASAVAAVGLQYATDEVSLGMEESFHATAKFYHGHLLEANIIEAIKVCSLLSLYSILTKSTTSLAYAGMIIHYASFVNTSKHLQTWA
jgi:hypothetical protein